MLRKYNLIDLTGALAVAAFLCAMSVMALSSKADARMTLSIKQERLLGLPNRFTVKVPDFQQNGKLTPYRVKEDAEKILSSGGIEIVKDDKEEPLARITVNIVLDSGGDGKSEPAYLIDINVYNISTISTEYDLREGTVWKIGSYREPVTKSFPREVDWRIKKLLEYFIEDYFTANPYLKKPAPRK